MSGWGKLPDQVKEDLENWFNSTEITYAEKTELARLYFSGRFHAWNCHRCGERVYYGEPLDWSKFQGVLQADYSSYPGDDEVYQPDYLAKLCDECRVSNPRFIPDYRSVTMEY